MLISGIWKQRLNSCEKNDRGISLVWNFDRNTQQGASLLVKTYYLMKDCIGLSRLCTSSDFISLRLELRIKQTIITFFNIKELCRKNTKCFFISFSSFILQMPTTCFESFNINFTVAFSKLYICFLNSFFCSFIKKNHFLQPLNVSKNHMVCNSFLCSGQLGDERVRKSARGLDISKSLSLWLNFMKKASKYC